MSTNGGLSGHANGFRNGLTNGNDSDLPNGYHFNGDDAYERAPPSRPPSPELEVEFNRTPRVMLHPRLAEAPSRHELFNSIPTSQPPFFNGNPAYTHTPSLSARGLRERSVNGGATTHGVGLSTPAPTSSRHLQIPGQEDRLAVDLEGLQLSSCTDNMLIPTPFNTPAATPRTSPRTPGRISTASGIEVPANTPATSFRSSAPAAGPRLSPANFGSPLQSTRQRGGGPKKKKKGKLTNGNTNGRAKGKGTAKDKMLDDASTAVAHGDSPIYKENIAAILQHPEAIAVLSSAPDVEATPIVDLLSSGEIKDAVADFVSNGRSGFNDPDWLEEAVEAGARRDAGEYDELLEAKFNEDWAEDSGEEYSD